MSPANPNASWPLQLWKLGAGPRERRPLALRVPTIGAAGPHHAFSPDGRWLATSTSDSVVVIWDLRAELPIFRLIHAAAESRFVGAERWVLALGFTEEGKLAVVWDCARIDLFDVASGASIATQRSTAMRDQDAAVLSPSAAWCVVDWHDGR
jgi:WD40 repeat protein